ncbi:MAG: alpha/beta hydrolase [Leptolyngbya sp. SIO1E4]|nr:alpha/beta hydrolase [Leptolyngbya sp. SIO1E4]
MQLQVEVKGRGYPVLCLHGHPGNGRCLSVFTDSLAQRFRTIAPDLRGYGQSRVQQPFRMTTHLDDLTDLLQNLQIDNCLILGWSLGGILALEMALRYPQRISGLILVATAARPRGNHPPITAADNIYTAIASLLNRLAPGWQWNIETFGKRSLYRYLIQQHTPEAYERLAHEALPAFLQTSKFAQKALSHALQQGYNQLPAVAGISAPSLVLCGECDRHITAASSQETAQHLTRSTAKIYPQTAHLFPWEIPTQVLSDIDTWLQQHFPNNHPLQT